MMLPFTQMSGRFAVWKREELTMILDRIVLSPLTAEAPELRLIEQFLDDVCIELPFLRIPWFQEQTKRPDTDSVPEAWWQGVTNAIMASGINSKALNCSFCEMAVYSWAFFRNAYAILPELIIHGDSLGAAQAVMAMVMFMRQSADTRTTALLLSIAIRMQHTAGLRVSPTSQSIPSPVEEENRSRLYWAAFILDMDMTLSTGLPPLHADEGVMVDLQGEGRRDIVFRLRAELGGIQRRIRTQLITPRRADLSVLESELETWCLRVPLEIRPTWPDRPESASSDQATDVCVAMLHFAYYNSVSMICWASITAQMLESLQAVDSIHDGASGHKSVARVAARAAISSLSRFPTQSFAELW
jgi:hypothetical protein